MLDLIIVATALAVAGWLAFARRMRGSSFWHAMVTPLASIMGSGFFVCAPLLAGIAGRMAVFFMAGLLLLAYLIGAAVRFNIRHFEPMEAAAPQPVQAVEALSRLVLAGAYFISVSYYLQLLAAFLVDATGIANGLNSPMVAAALVVLIGAVGMWRGLKALEALEIYAVSLKLGIVAALLLGLAVFNLVGIAEGSWHLPPAVDHFDTERIRILLGLLIVVQGFETSRYIGAEHPSEERIASMRSAQIVAAVIYILFVAMVTPLFHPGVGADVTAIVAMVRPVAIVLPALLIVAAVASQFSAGVADNAGAGGLIEEITHRRVPIRYAYLLVMLVTLAVTWETNVLEVIAYASRAFALYYMLQCLVAYLVAGRVTEMPHRRLRQAGFAAMAAVCLLVFVFGLPSA